MTRRAAEKAIERIAEALNLDREGNAYRGRCPAHISNSGRSFWIGVSAMGGLKLKCYAGCAYAELRSALELRGLLRPRSGSQPQEADRTARWP
jgi:hypothetical protein